MPDRKLMAHLVAGYPDLETSRDIALALAEGGADFLEIQFPFSDPSADGPRIERACHAALAAGFTVSSGFELAGELAGKLAIPLFIMTYASLATAKGSGDFATKAAAAGVRGIIVPDLPPDYDEGLYDAGGRAGLAVVPVVAPGISEARLDLLRRLRPEYVYTALRLGVTGRESRLDSGNREYLARIGSLGAKIVAGFGVRSSEQFLALSGQVHAVAVGTFFLDCLEKAGGKPAALIRAVAGLKGGGFR
ncbi:MAG: tryptophan synthase subunit alpha [Planctomycetota bacterium]|jgi:tryptophan synthase alpha chain|nr:tryptophan synthase subunit alpha [Planctomycetota bacterium]